MRNLRRLGNQIEVSIEPDSDGFMGRECPNPECEGYFKVESGTGLHEEGLPCHCPYCGHSGGQDEFFTREQIEYGKSVAMRRISDAIYKDLKSLEFTSKPPRGSFGIGMSLKVNPGRRVPVRFYREKELETTVVCQTCSLRYAIYGLFAFCPDCRERNSPQILERNLVLAKKELDLASTLEGEISRHLIEDALENAVSMLDGFGRQMCGTYADLATKPKQAENLSFQSIATARRKVQHLFQFDIATGMDDDQWKTLTRAFQKRHVIAHRMGVVDQKYIDVTGDTEVAVGRLVQVNASEVTVVLDLVRAIGDRLEAGLRRRKSALEDK